MDTNYNTGDLLDWLILEFFRGSHKFTLEPNHLKSLTWEKQKAFLDTTVHSERLEKYPVNKEFSRVFFKKIIMYLELCQEVHDDFYTYLCSVISNENEKQDFSYRHYVIANDLKSIITIKETNNIVVNGTTGLRTWDAALILADWALCNKNMFGNKQVLELGSGVGFTGITIAKLCETNNILLTDCHCDVLKTICDNIETNFPHLSKEENTQISEFTDGKMHIGVMNLDWNFIEDISSNIVPDILIGADIIYDPSIIGPLCGVIKTLFTRNMNLEVFIVSIVRNEDTFQRFLDALDSKNFTWEIISHAKNIYIQWNQNIQSCLLSIKNS